MHCMTNILYGALPIYDTTSSKVTYIEPENPFRDGKPSVVTMTIPAQIKRVMVPSFELKFHGIGAQEAAKYFQQQLQQLLAALKEVVGPDAPGILFTVGHFPVALKADDPYLDYFMQCGLASFRLSFTESFGEVGGPVEHNVPFPFEKPLRFRCKTVAKKLNF